MTTRTLNIDAVRQNIEHLRVMLDYLYPHDISVDIITLKDVQTRYPLTGLGAPAISAIQQSHRILRGTKDFEQSGLAAFHTGLIYLHWGECLMAAQQFAEARQQWQLVHNASSICLSYFAEGCAQHHIFHYEDGMSNYNQTERWLARLKITEPSSHHDQFLRLLTDRLATAMHNLREKLWPPEQEKVQDQEQVQETAVPSYTPPQPTPTPEQISLITETPIEPISEMANNIPAPIITLTNGQSHSPIPALHTTSHTHRWYEVEDKQNNFLPDIHKGAWLLIDTQFQRPFEAGDLIIIGANDDNMDGSIPVRPFSHTRPFDRIYLSKVEFTGSFTRDTNSGEVTLILDTGTRQVQTENIIGIVIGAWLSSFKMEI